MQHILFFLKLPPPLRREITKRGERERERERDRGQRGGDKEHTETENRYL